MIPYYCGPLILFMVARSEIMVDLSVPECPDNCDECEYVKDSGETLCKKNKCKPGFGYNLKNRKCYR